MLNVKPCLLSLCSLQCWVSRSLRRRPRQTSLLPVLNVSGRLTRPWPTPALLPIPPTRMPSAKMRIGSAASKQAFGHKNETKRPPSGGLFSARREDAAGFSWINVALILSPVAPQIEPRQGAAKMEILRSAERSERPDAFSDRSVTS
jgi:hypothetical protein